MDEKETAYRYRSHGQRNMMNFMAICAVIALLVPGVASAFSTGVTSNERVSTKRMSSANGGIPSRVDWPDMTPQGVYQIDTEDQYYAFLNAHPDKLVVIKFYASYCRTCKLLEPKFLYVKADKQLEGLPIVWAQFGARRNNKNLFRTLEILTLPTIHFYDGSRGLVENFPLPPAKIPMFKKKLAQFLNARVDPTTLTLKPDIEWQQPTQPRQERSITMDLVSTNDELLITTEHVDYLWTGLDFFRDLSYEEFRDMLAKASLQTYNPGDVIIRQGMPPKSFFVIKSGVAEMCVKSKFDDPISTPPNYLGAVVNELTKFDYFGERALSTAEPYAASVRVLEKTRCFVFNVEDIPESSILSKQRRASREMIDKLNQRYVLPEGYTPSYAATPKDDSILELLVRFKQIRQAAMCFKYIMNTEPTWGDTGQIARRSKLVSKLSKSQREEFQKVFELADVHKRGKISLLNMREFIESSRTTKTDSEMLEMIQKANPLYHGRVDYGITRDEFMGVMAEAEFYSLFTETFEALDKDKTGYVKAGDLDEVLGGVRDLISGDRKSIIDVEDKDMLVDYEQFSKMLLGAAI